MKEKMIKAIVLIIAAICGINASAQWGVGADLRLAPWYSSEGNWYSAKNESTYIGSDINFNYNISLPYGLYLLPEMGIFYHNLYKTIPYQFPDGIIITPEMKAKARRHTYKVGIDVTALIGYRFAKHWSIFTGPRYGYAFIKEPSWFDYQRNSLWLRAGLAYHIGKWSISAKCDIAFCRVKHLIYDREKQSTALVIGFRRQF